MTTDLFRLLCTELGYDPASVLVIRVRPDGAAVTYTEPSGMPRGRSHRLGRDQGRAA
ncbi:hypothetical protein [Modestobacter sp. I12A-02662]|uniref:hypothetical protein n=1 Tax=Modestobacter sp. I12A-02662 TaxID=1730496 RepID=UPI0034E04F32